jgi:hypothetical protein
VAALCSAVRTTVPLGKARAICASASGLKRCETAWRSRGHGELDQGAAATVNCGGARWCLTARAAEKKRRTTSAWLDIATW